MTIPNPYWMNPRNLGDLPIEQILDQMIVPSRSHIGPIKMERLVLEIEKYFYDFKLRPKI